jgi:hypothetical protein
VPRRNKFSKHVFLLRLSDIAQVNQLFIFKISDSEKASEKNDALRRKKQQLPAGRCGRNLKMGNSRTQHW